MLLKFIVLNKMGQNAVKYFIHAEGFPVTCWSAKFLPQGHVRNGFAESAFLAKIPKAVRPD